jgi:hypothetical protein
MLTCAVVRQLADAVEAQVDDLLADGVVAAGKVVGGVLLAADQLLGVEQLAVGASADLIDDSGLQQRISMKVGALMRNSKAHHELTLWLLLKLQKLRAFYLLEVLSVMKLKTQLFKWHWFIAMYSRLEVNGAEGRTCSRWAGEHLQVKEHAARDVLASTSLRKEGVESVVTTADGLVAGHLSIGLDA